MDFDAVGKNFVQYYYNVFDTNRENLAPLYQAQSLLTFEGERFQGADAIKNKLVSLPFQRVKHDVQTIDCQPSVSGGIIVFVSGQLMVDDSPAPLKFSQTFHLAAGANNSFWVTNDLFRLNYG
eukprot:GEZU01032580.1.p1 GENE.GEZU01032580.1~~GEZU01032580.1.p1  ORF type:complete len:132 (+),score=38.48 GEZU01032580.1:29-397(+)